MVAVIIFTLIAIIAMFFMGFILGRDTVFSSLKNKGVEDRNYAIAQHNGGIWIFFIYIFIVFGVCALINVGKARDECIDDYRNHKITEMVKYTYKIIDGEKTLTDSTFYYSKNKFGN